jgi:hypothetical protein
MPNTGELDTTLDVRPNPDGEEFAQRLEPARTLEQGDRKTNMNAALEFGKALLALVLTLSLIAVALLLAAYECFAVPRLVNALAADTGLRPMYVYVGVPALFGVVLLLSSIDDLGRGGHRFWRLRVVLGLFIAVFLATAMELVWALLIGGLVTGAGQPDATTLGGPVGRLVDEA